MHIELMKHQKEAVDFALKKNGVAAFYHEVGCGKTLSALMLFDKLRRIDPTLKLLVICPLALIYGAWTREINKFTEYNWMDLHGMGVKDFGRCEIMLINFEGLISQTKFDFVKDMLKKVPNWMCVIDESSKMNFLSDDILGSNFYKFKNTHFALMRNNQIVPGQFMNASMIRKMHQQGFKYEIVPAKKIEMFNQMKPWCHFIKAKDCIDLPEEIDEFRMVQMADTQARVYKEMEKQYIAELVESGTVVVANVILTKLMKLRQITSGFAIDDMGNEIPVTPVNPKIRALLDIIEECGKEQMIIWCQFHWEVDTIRGLLALTGEGVSELHGEVKYKGREEELDKFLTGKNRFLIAHPKTVAHGYNLQHACHISVYFSLDYSFENYGQSRGRILRNGQKQKCLFFHILAKDTIDEDVLAIVQKKKTMQDVAQEYLGHAV